LLQTTRGFKFVYSYHKSNLSYRGQFQFNFEDGTLGGFTTSGTNATGVVVNTTEKAFKGERGLKWTVTSEGEELQN